MGDGHTAPVVNPWSTSNIGSAFAMKIHTIEPYNHRNKQVFYGADAGSRIITS